MTDLPEFNIGDELDYYLWNCTPLELLGHNEIVEIKQKSTGVKVKATYDKEEGAFTLGWGGYLNIPDVNWRKLFPESVIERAARNYNNILKELK
jgi:hypothetical protein